MNRLRRTRVPALVAAVLMGLLVTGCAEDEPTAADPVPAADSTQPEAPESGAPESEGDEQPAGTVAAPAYFVDDTPLGPRLFREFRQVESDNPADEVLALIAAGDTLDPDYRTLLPEGAPTYDSYDENIVIEIPAVWAQRPDGMTDAQADLAIQQIVYTIQGVLQQRIPVTFTVGGDSSPILGLDEGAYEAAEQLDVLGLVNITAPEQGDSVSGSFTASGVASSFEANVLWQIRDAADEIVLDGFVTAEGWVDRLHPWETEIDVSGLAAGTYTFVALTDDPSAGEGPGPTEDTKTITIG